MYDSDIGLTGLVVDARLEFVHHVKSTDTSRVARRHGFGIRLIMEVHSGKRLRTPAGSWLLRCNLTLTTV